MASFWVRFGFVFFVQVTDPAPVIGFVFVFLRHSFLAASWRTVLRVSRLWLRRVRVSIPDPSVSFPLCQATAPQATELSIYHPVRCVAQDAEFVNTAISWPKKIKFRNPASDLCATSMFELGSHQQAARYIDLIRRFMRFAVSLYGRKLIRPATVGERSGEWYLAQSRPSRE